MKGRIGYLRLVYRVPLLLLHIIIGTPATVLCQTTPGRSIRMGGKPLSDIMICWWGGTICRIFALDRRVEGKDVGLLGNLRDQIENPIDLPRTAAQGIGPIRDRIHVLTYGFDAGNRRLEGRGTVASDANGVTRLVNFSANNNDRLSTLITAATCPAFNGAIVKLLQTTPAATMVWVSLEP